MKGFPDTPNIHHVLILAAFSASVVYMFSAFLLEQNYIEDIAAANSPFRPSEEQVLTARRLNLEHRMMATIKETWPACVEHDMTATQCKEFIDEEILTLFSGDDKYIQSYIRGHRSIEDEWYHVVEIYMDDNDLVVGRNGDGLVYYDFEWRGSGVEATDEQQTAIPPVTSVETLRGAVVGQTVKTIYATPPANITLINRVPWNDWISDAEVQSHTNADGDVFDFSEPPIVLVDKPVLVVGSTIDGVLNHNETNPINGGVLLDPSTVNTEVGDARLAEELSLTYVIAEAGLRSLGPFNCRHLTGFSCCLLIKHQVRDSDHNGRAIQCHLDYEASTCKHHYADLESAKKVLIVENEYGKVSQAPYIQGAWPSCHAAGDPGNENGAPLGVGGNNYIEVDSGETTTAEPSGGLWSDGDTAASDTSNLPDLGSCPETWILEEWRYVAGDQVSSNGIVVQCKDHPFSSHCGQAGYKPFDQTSNNWKIAWDSVGTCSGEPISGSKAAGSDFLPPTSPPTIPETNSPTSHPTYQPPAMASCPTAFKTAATASAPVVISGHWTVGYWWQNNGYVHNWGNHWRSNTKQMQLHNQCNCQGGHACKHLEEAQTVECGACMGKQACMLGRASHYPADSCIGDNACKLAGECFGVFSCRGWQACMLTRAAVGDGSCWNTYEDDGGPATCAANQGLCEEINGPGDDAFACKNSGSIIGTNSCRGYRSCADSDELTSVGNQSCIGKHACWNLKSSGCISDPNSPSCRSGTVGTASCLGKESCYGANAIVGDYSCHGFQSCISVTENTVIGAASCIGSQSCRNLNARIGAQSCVTPEMNDDIAYNFETDTPQSVCEGNSGQISGLSCWSPKSCQNNQGRICGESCRGNMACQNNSGSVGERSCTSEGSCRNNSGNIGAGACTIAGGCENNTENIPDNCPSLAAKQAGQCSGTVTLACND